VAQEVSPQAVQAENGKSLLTQFRPKLFVEHHAWRSLERILRTGGGGSYGLAGPRGAGKTWAMEKALHEAKEKGGIGVWFPSPSEYEPTAFLAALSDVVAIRYQRYYDTLTDRATRAVRQRYRRRTTAGLLVLLLAALLYIRASVGEYNSLSSWLGLSTLLMLALSALGVYLLIEARNRSLRERRGLGKVRSEAEELRQQVRYAMNSSETDELGVEGAYGGIGARLRRARERELIERPATLSSLIHTFRSFVEAIAEEVDGPVVIAIDELDKMSDASRVAQLFRDIKGIFEVPGAYFLVSLSDEAARALELGGVRTRNEFNSSFYTVISLPPLAPEQCLELLRKRDPGFDRARGLAIGILSGGVSREVVRMGERTSVMVEAPDSVPEALRVLTGEELEAFAAQVLVPVGSPEETMVSESSRVNFFDRLDGFERALEGDAETFAAGARAGWALNGDCPGWRVHLQEEWRRILVRLAIAWYVGFNRQVLGEEAAIAELQQIVRTAAGSAAVGRFSLEVFLSDRQLASQAVPRDGHDDFA
jgi:KAP family P-loop domain